MTDDVDYSKLTLEELLVEEKKLKKSEIFSALGIGILVGVMVFGVAKNGFGFLYIFIPLLFISGIVKNSQKHKDKRKQIRAEISAKTK